MDEASAIAFLFLTSVEGHFPLTRDEERGVVRIDSSGG